MKDELLIVAAIVGFSLFMALVGAGIQEQEQHKKAVAVGAGYWTADSHGNPKFKYITE